MIKKLLSVIALTVACVTAQAAGGSYPLDKAPNRLTDQAALQHGAKTFVNYCLNCHAATSMRYNKLRDIGLTDTQIKENLLFTGEKVGDLMKIAMTSADAKAWFGAPPPDLSVIARASQSMQAPPVATTFIPTCVRFIAIRPNLLGGTILHTPMRVCHTYCGNVKAPANTLQLWCIKSQKTVRNNGSVPQVCMALKATGRQRLNPCLITLVKQPVVTASKH